MSVFTNIFVNRLASFKRTHKLNTFANRLTSLSTQYYFVFQELQSRFLLIELQFMLELLILELYMSQTRAKIEYSIFHSSRARVKKKMKSSLRSKKQVELEFEMFNSI